MASVQRLYELLQALQALLEQLMVSLQQQKESIVALNTVEAERRAAELTELFSRVAPLNQQLVAEVATTREAAGLTGEKALTALCSALPKPERELLGKLQSTVQAKAAAVNDAVMINRTLLADSLRFTDKSLQLFTNALRQTSSTLYGQQGRFVEAPEQPHIICKEI